MTEKFGTETEIPWNLNSATGMKFQSHLYITDNQSRDTVENNQEVCYEVQ